MDSNNTTSTGIEFTGALFITFLVLKLTHVIDWHWIWIFAPLWIPLAIFLLVVLIALLYKLIEHIIGEIQRYFYINKNK